MSLFGILIGLINCVILALILILIGAVIVWLASLFGWPIPWNIQRIYLAIVALITLACIIGLLAGYPMVHFVPYAHTEVFPSLIVPA
jgi:hypothetical protein